MWLICENWNLFLKFHSQVMLLYCFEVNCARFPFRTFWSLKWYLSCCKCLYILSKLILFMWSTLVFSFFGFRFNNMVIAQSIKISIRNCVPALKFVGNTKGTNLDKRIYILVRWPSYKNRIGLKGQLMKQTPILQWAYCDYYVASSLISWGLCLKE